MLNAELPQLIYFFDYIRNTSFFFLETDTQNDIKTLNDLFMYQWCQKVKSRILLLIKGHEC